MASTSSIARPRRGARRSPQDLGTANPGGSYEIRPIRLFEPGSAGDVTDIGLDRCGADAPPGPRRSARCCAISAISTTAEEAFQEACLRALRTWPRQRPAARSRRVAHLRRPQRRARRRAPPQAGSSRCRRTRLHLRPRGRRGGSSPSGSTARTIATTSCACCSSAAIPELPATQQIALALRIVSGLSVTQIARAFLVSESAMEQRITRAKAPHRQGRGSLRDAGRGRAGRAARRRRRHDLPAVQRGLLGERRRRARPRAAVRGGDPARPPAAPAVSRRARDHGAHGAAAAAACARAGAASMRTARSCCWRTRTAACGTARMIAEGLALVDKALRHRRPGPYQVQAAIAALHARAARSEETDWARDRSALCAPWSAAAFAGRDAQPRRCGRQAARPGGGACHDRAAGRAARRLFSFLRRARARCSCSSAAPTRPAPPSTGPSRSPTRQRRRRTSGCISTG